MATAAWLLLVPLWAAAVWICGDQAQAKGRNAAAWAVASVVTSWFAVLVLLCLPPKTVNPRACPACGSTIPGAATRCRFCTSEVAPTVRPLAAAAVSPVRPRRWSARWEKRPVD